MKNHPWIEHIQHSVWLASIAGALILWVSFGVRQAIGLFLIPVTKDMGWDRTTFSIAAALMQLMWGCGQPFIVYLGERQFGFGKVIFISSLLYATSSWIMYASYHPGVFIFAAVLQGLTAGGNSFPIVLASVGQRVGNSKYKSIVFGVVSSFGSFGQCCFLPMGRAMISSLGWRWTFMTFGLMMVAMSPLAMFIQTVPEESDHATVPGDEEKVSGPKKEMMDKTEFDKQGVEHQDMSLIQVLKKAFVSPTFILITLGFSVCGFHVAFLSTHLPAYLVDHSISSSLAAWVISVIGLGSMFGTISVGYICTRVKPKYVLTAIYLGRAIILCVFFWVPTSIATVFTFSVIFGFLWLSTVPATTKFVGDLFGPKYLGTLTSITFVGHQIGAFCGAFIGGLVYDSMQNYSRLFYASIALAVFASVANLFARDNQPVLSK
ncbi:major facilitator superfamily domain-containing protein [Chlamydoabsidia padenii]|nr:major facilitator superfamily domain-containing protein [Chlamydoabsidia padenii]